MNTQLPIGVCGWCIDRNDIVRSLEIAGRGLGLRHVQIGFFSENAARNADSAAIRGAATAADIAIVRAFIAFEDEDYTSIARIAETGGFMPDNRFESRLAIARAAADVAAAIGCPSLSVHAGTVPVDETSPAYVKLRDRVRLVAEYMAHRGLRLLLETGREPADALLQFMESVARSNVGVNFDPGNFVVYGTEEPVTAVTKLKGRIELVHLKDAVRSARPRVDYGRSVPLGSGDVQVARVVSKLRATGYRGPLLVECDTREMGQEVVHNAAEYLRTMLG